MIIALNFIFWPHHAACRILVPRPGIKPVPPAVETWSLNHWTAREVPPYCSPQWLHRSAFPLTVYKCSNFSTSQSIHVVFCVFDDSHTDRYEVISHCDYDLYCPDGQRHSASFQIHSGHLYVFFGEMSNQVFSPFFNQVFFALSCRSSLYFEINPLSDIWLANVFYHSLVAFPLC